MMPHFAGQPGGWIFIRTRRTFCARSVVFKHKTDFLYIILWLWKIAGETRHLLPDYAVGDYFIIDGLRAGVRGRPIKKFCTVRQNAKRTSVNSGVT